MEKLQLSELSTKNNPKLLLFDVAGLENHRYRLVVDQEPIGEGSGWFWTVSILEGLSGPAGKHPGALVSGIYTMVGWQSTLGRIVGSCYPTFHDQCGISRSFLAPWHRVYIRLNGQSTHGSLFGSFSRKFSDQYGISHSFLAL